MGSLLCPSLVLVPRGHHFMVSRGHAMVHDVARMARFHRILLSRAGDNEHRIWISLRGGDFVKPISLACACPSRVAVLHSVSYLFYISMLCLSHDFPVRTFAPAFRTEPRWGTPRHLIFHPLGTGLKASMRTNPSLRVDAAGVQHQTFRKA